MNLEDMREGLLKYLDTNMITHTILAGRIEISTLTLRAFLADTKKINELTTRKIAKFLKENGLYAE